jgi:hypothetical protein
VATLEQELETLQAVVDSSEHAHRDTAEDARTTDSANVGHVRFLATPDGYALSGSEESCPGPGDFVEVDGSGYLVARTGPSPLPGDERPCAFLVLEPVTLADS